MLLYGHLPKLLPCSHKGPRPGDAKFLRTIGGVWFSAEPRYTRSDMKTIDIITIFPEAVEPYLGASMLKRAQEKRRVRIAVHDLREWARGKHRQVDDRPYGGGAGMVMMVEPFHRALRALKATSRQPQAASRRKRTRVILTSAKGKPFTQRDAERYAKKYDRLVILAGHYEGVDERVAEHLADEEVSIGPYVLTGGELPALVITDAVVRLIPGVLGNAESSGDESHQLPATSTKQCSRLKLAAGGWRLEYPHYTRPADFSPKRGMHWKVPNVLLSGNHSAVVAWRAGHRT